MSQKAYLLFYQKNDTLMKKAARVPGRTPEAVRSISKKREERVLSDSDLFLKSDDTEKKIVKSVNVQKIRSLVKVESIDTDDGIKSGRKRAVSRSAYTSRHNCIVFDVSRTIYPQCYFKCF